MPAKGRTGTMRTTLKACEQRDLPAWAVDGPACREVGVRFIRDTTGYGHWTCPAHEGILRAYFNAQAREADEAATR